MRRCLSSISVALRWQEGQRRERSILVKPHRNITPNHGIIWIIDIKEKSLLGSGIPTDADWDSDNFAIIFYLQWYITEAH